MMLDSRDPRMRSTPLLMRGPPRMHATVSLERAASVASSGRSSCQEARNSGNGTGSDTRHSATDASAHCAAISGWHGC